MNKIFDLISTPLMFLNRFAGIVSGVWLAVLLEWHVLGIGVILAIFGHWAISAALLPNFIFIFLGGLLAERWEKIVRALAFLNLLYTNTVILVWCVGLMVSFAALINNEGALLPALIWSYSTSFAPLAYLVRHDVQAGNSSGIWSLAFAQAAHVLGIVMFLFGVTTETVAIVFGILMFCAATLTVAVESD